MGLIEAPDSKRDLELASRSSHIVAKKRNSPSFYVWRLADFWGGMDVMTKWIPPLLQKEAQPQRWQESKYSLIYTSA